MIDSEKSFPIAKFMQLMVLSCMMLFSFSAWSETATATDESTDVIVAGKIIQNQQKTSNSQNVEQENVQPLQVENDLADGETIRTLPTLNEPVIDQANILSASEKQQISVRILKLNEQAKAQIGVVIVPTTGQEDIFDFTMRVAEQWKLGSEKQDNGLLMAIAINDRRIQIATGYGLEGVLPDIVASRIIRNNITPYFKQNQFAQGIDAGLAEIENILNMDPEIATQAALELKERQAQALHEQQAKEKTFNTALFILIAGIIGSFVVGKRLSASTAAVAGTVAGLVNGAGLLTSLLIGGGIFFLLITTIAQVLFQAVLSGSGGRGGGSGGGFGGGGYRGGGGGFGGGGASGSW
ncbi:TPM domain-containing protein [Acinetobacter faecalis]|uniref:TPM domain-containing protein n=2 Tax=Acinetobacter faecalis TaxID=2665161 RepID=A0AB35UY33_9GAMM|nr:TPM domain-containing protein [Acinetobacter faecalis]MBP7783164.1 TPM domain-containing protein [Acinetobacter sp.]MBP7793648.1 TPM domain-containing protein [Acinetobacter sp.]MDY6449406.1 TPM domain-containing protein [Acinetobacter faecalis]MDY6481335.1 TPM domain-containing protein [Acinetobacter faecalis]MDY6485871.1 TPM domain-containing protein [Acinetobacter faecalis]